MLRARTLTLWIVFAAPLLAQTGPGQSPPPASPAPKARADDRAEWLQRARSFTAAIETDKFFLPPR